MNEKCCPRPGVIFEIFPLLHQAPAKARVELLNFDIDNLLNTQYWEIHFEESLSGSLLGDLIINDF